MAGATLGCGACPPGEMRTRRHLLIAVIIRP